MVLTRPVLRYHGGKWNLAPWVISHFPPHRVYVEPFGGAASVLLRKQRSYAEVYNDLDDDVVNLFSVLRDREKAEELVRQLRLTPFSRVEFMQTYDAVDGLSDIERARRLVFRSFAGFGTSATTGRWRTGFRSSVWRDGSTPAHDWANYPDALMAVVERLQGVVIEHDTALRVISRYDGPGALFYVDPPYLPETRGVHAHVGYSHEMTPEDHVNLSNALHRVQGYVVLSGYDSGLYRELYRDWRMIRRETYADGTRPRTEVLWLSPNMPAVQPGLFDGES